jgi:UDP-glucose 4-epimerase
MKVLVTGGAGFIGSHIIDSLLSEGYRVVCVDDLSLGKEKNIQQHRENPHFIFIKLDILNKNNFQKVFNEHDFEHVFHLAANSDIAQGAIDLTVDLHKTFMTTFTTLECMKKYKVNNIIFASTSAIYGELDTLLHEDCGPLFPVSFYGASKLASEAYISAFCENFDMKSWIFRFPNVVGERATHGAMFDFINKLRKNPKELVILGDGTQTKPYLYVKDIVDGIFFGWKSAQQKLNYFNLGVDSATTVTKIAEIVVEEMGLSDVKFIYTGGDRGWIGDVPKFQYSLSKINSLGWKAKRTSDEAIRLAVRTELGKVK